MTYDVLGPGPLDYLPCRYGTSKLLFRGPRRNLDQPYLAFIGSTETYGKFIKYPFPSLVEREMGRVCANFGQINAGIDAFAYDPFVLDAASGADVTVVQVLGAQNMTNRFYSVHPRRNDRFLKAGTVLQAFYGEVDFSEFHFNKHMLGELLQVSPDRFETVKEELQEAWKARMRLMLRQIAGKSILLWFSERSPDEPCETLSLDPLFVTREMLSDVAEDATEVVEVVASRTAMAAGTDGMVFADLDAPAAAELMGPKAHEEAASAVISAVGRLL